MTENPAAGFETVMLCYLDDAFNLASWILRDRSDAEDAVQDAMVRALKYYPSFRGTNPRAWLLQIVRNSAYASLKKSRQAQFVPLIEEQGGDASLALGAVELVSTDDDPEAQVTRLRGRRLLDRALAELPAEQRECLVLKELDDMSYQEIAEITETPIGTVMSRLWRARQALSKAVRRREIAS